MCVFSLACHHVEVITSTAGDQLVQIMPVSFRNEKGLPETINVVITMPQADADKKDVTATLAAPLRPANLQPMRYLLTIPIDPIRSPVTVELNRQLVHVQIAL